jgi:hypothetical protein
MEKELDKILIMEYRKKPVVIEAFKYGIDNIPDWFMDKVTSNEIITHVGTDIRDSSEYFCEIKTLEGIMRGNCGDYIIKGIKGEIYPCKSDIFEITYELASTPSQTKISDKVLFEQATVSMEEHYGYGSETEIDAYFRGAKWMQKQYETYGKKTFIDLVSDEESQVHKVVRKLKEKKN